MSAHQHSWRVKHQPHGPTCEGCGASLIRIIEAERKARERNHVRDDFDSRPFVGFTPMRAA